MKTVTDCNRLDEMMKCCFMLQDGSGEICTEEILCVMKAILPIPYRGRTIEL